MAANNKVECLFGDVARIACEAGRESAKSPKIREYIDSCLVFEFAMHYYGGPLLADLFGVEKYDALQGFSRIAKTFELRPGYGTEAPAGDGKTIQCGAYASMKGWAAADSMDSMRAAPHLGLSGFSEEADFSLEYGRAEHMGALILRVYVIIDGERILAADYSISVSGATNAVADLNIAMEIAPSVMSHIKEKLGGGNCEVVFPGQENAKMAVSNF